MDEEEEMPGSKRTMPPPRKVMRKPMPPAMPPSAEDSQDEPEGDEQGAGVGDFADRGDDDADGEDDDYENYVGDGTGAQGTMPGDDDEGAEGEGDEDDDMPPSRRVKPARSARNMGRVQEERPQVPVDGDAILKAIQQGTADAVYALLAERIEPMERKLDQVGRQSAELTKAVNNGIVAHSEVLEEHRELRKSLEGVLEDRELVKSVFGKLEKAIGSSAAATPSQREEGDAAVKVLQKALIPAPDLSGAKPDAVAADTEVFKRALELKKAGRVVGGLSDAQAYVNARQAIPVEVREKIRKSVELLDKGATSVATDSNDSSEANENEEGVSEA